MDTDLTPTQSQVLESLFFVEPFDKIVEETGLPAAVVADELKHLIARRWVQVMTFNAEAGDFLPTAIYDGDRLQNCYFLATREGLMLLHGLSS
jgi:hypothetical protein